MCVALDLEDTLDDRIDRPWEARQSGDWVHVKGMVFLGATSCKM